MKSLLILGYKDYELGIFNENDPKLVIIKAFIRKKILQFLDEGVSWLIFTGNIGFEYWVYEIAREYQDEYDLQFAVIFPFRNHGENWSEGNKYKLSQYKQADYVEYAYGSYENPGQFRKYNEFLIQHTDACLLFYDLEQETNLKYISKDLKEAQDYYLIQLDFTELDDFMQDFYNN
jgi:Uncharacterized protein conserved in bacteria